VEILGLASGIDSQSIIDQLMLIERQPLNTLAGRKSTYQKQVSAWSDIKTRLVSLNNTLADLQVTDTFNSKKAVSADQNVASVSCQSTAIPGKYHLNVISLATSTRVESSGRMGQGLDPAAVLQDAGLGTQVTKGSFSINGTVFSVDPAVESLDDILAKINDPDTGVPGVTAAYQQDTGKLVLDSADPIQLGSGADTSNFFQAMWLDGQTGNSISSMVPLGTVQTDQALDQARFASALTSTASGSMEINGVTIEYDTTKDSLNDIISRINNSDAQVTAGYDALKDTLTLTAKYTGSKSIQLKDVSGNLLQAAGLTETNQVLGSNGEYYIEEINGGSMLTSTSNTIEGVIQGVVITLTGTGETVLTVEPNPDDTIKKVKAFVDQYNSTMSLMRSKLEKDAVLQGDSSLIGLYSAIRRNVTDQVTGGTELSLAWEIGLEIDKDGVMSLDEEKFRNALAAKPDAVFELFNAEDGIASRLEKEINSWTLDANGVIPQKEDFLNRCIEDTDKSIETMEARLEQKRQLLVKQFTAMEKAMSTLMSQSSWLSGQIATLPGMSQDSSS